MRCKNCGMGIEIDPYQWSRSHKGYKHEGKGFNKCCNAKRGFTDHDAWAEPDDKETRIKKLLCAVDTVTDL